VSDYDKSLEYMIITPLQHCNESCVLLLTQRHKTAKKQHIYKTTKCLHNK